MPYTGSNNQKKKKKNTLKFLNYSSARSVNTIDPEILEILIFTF
jgi:hypothetical protein